MSTMVEIENQYNRANYVGRSVGKKRGSIDEPNHPVYISDRKAGQTYVKGRILGKGGFAKCYEFTHIGTRHICAGKCVNKRTLEKNSRARSKLHSEIKIHRSLRHNKIVRFEHFFEDNTHVYILLELCNKETLLELVKRKRRLKENHAKWLILQILEGVEYLHSEKVIHRDLKLGNLFLTDNMDIKIGDFGLATRLEHDKQRKTTVCGTPNYIAPEVISGKKGHSYEVDIWSIGIILYTLLIGKPPFETKDVKSTYKRIKANDYNFPPIITLSEGAKGIISKILTLDPNLRPTIQEIKEHAFFESSEKSIRAALSRVKLSQPSDKLTEPPVEFEGKREEKVDVLNVQTPSPKPKCVNKLNQKANCTEEVLTNIAVTKWVDYTSKYGLGYLLRGGIVGVYFNDSTKIVVDPDRNRFEYYERGSKVKRVHTLQDHPKELTKKVTLLKHFRSYLEKKQVQEQKDMNYSVWVNQDRLEQLAREEVELSLKKNADLPYIKKWIRTRHAIFFRLSTRKVQVAFFDGTQLLLSPGKKYVSFIDKEMQMISVPMNETRTRSSIAARLKYTKQVLNQLIEHREKDSTESHSKN